MVIVITFNVDVLERFGYIIFLASDKSQASERARVSAASLVFL